MIFLESSIGFSFCLWVQRTGNKAYLVKYNTENENFKKSINRKYGVGGDPPVFDVIWIFFIGFL